MTQRPFVLCSLLSSALLSCVAPSVAVVPPAPAEPDVAVIFPPTDQGSGLTDSYLDRLADFVGSSLVRSGHFEIIPMAETRAALRAEKAESYRECYDESCRVEIGRELAAAKSVSITVARFGDQCVVTLQVYDLRKNTQESAGAGRGGCGEREVLAAVDDAVEDLTGFEGPPPPPTVAVEAPLPSSSNNRKPSRPDPDRLWPGDRLALDLPHLRASMPTDEIVIRPDGIVTLPFAGELELAGLTLEDADEKIKQAMSAYLKDPSPKAKLIERARILERPTSTPYRLRRRDRVFVRVFRMEALATEQIIDPKGAIEMPMIGEVIAARLTVLELTERIRQALGGIVVDPVVHVRFMGRAQESDLERSR